MPTRENWLGNGTCNLHSVERGHSIKLLPQPYYIEIMHYTHTCTFRYEKLAEQEELSYQQQRRKLFGEVQQEKEKLAAQFHQQKVLLEQQQRQMEEDKLR